MTKNVTLILLFFCAFLAQSQTNILGQYLNFNGNSIATDGEYVEVADNSSLDFDATTSFTIQFWLNPTNLQTSASTEQGIVTKKAGAGNGYGIYWDVTGGGDGEFELRLKETSASGNNSQSIATPTITDVNTMGWTHFTAVVKRNNAPAFDTAYIYFNGALQVKAALNSIGDVSNGSDVMFMNFDGTTPVYAAGGRLDEVRIWNVALTEKQIQRFYSEPIVEGTLGLVNGAESGKKSILSWSNLVGYWPMEDALGSVQITDQSNNSNTGVFYEGNSGVACVSSPCGPSLVGGTISSAPTAYIATTSGNWSTNVTWNGNNPPNDGRAQVFINPGVTVTLDGNFSCEQINIKEGGTLTAASGGVLQVEKYFDCDGTLDMKTAGNILFDQVGDHKIFGSGKLDFYNFELYQNSQLQVETDPGSPVNIYGILVHGDGRIRTDDNMALRVNKANTARPYGLISPVGSGGNPDIVGTLKMDKVLSSQDSGWRQMSLPFKGTLADFSGIPINDINQPTNQQNVFYWDNAEGASGFNAGWTAPDLYAGQGKAYSIFLGDPYFSFDDTVTFEGEYNWGDTTYNLTYFNDPGNGVAPGAPGYEDGFGWNFIPNRYPSLLDVLHIINDNPLFYKNIHIWDANTQQYMAFVESNGLYIVPYNNNGTGAGNAQILSTSIGAIEPMQGFWVKVSDVDPATNSLTVYDDWRSVNFNLNPYSSLKQNNHVQINVFAEADSAWDGTVLTFDEAENGQFSGKTDAYKIQSKSNVPSLFLQKDNHFLQVGSFASSPIKMHFIPQPQNKNGNYFLHQQAALQNGNVIIVEDLATGTRHNLSASNYHFNASGFAGTNRFLIHFVDEDDAQLENLNGSGIYTFATPNGLVLKSSFLTGSASVSVYNIAGQLVHHQNVLLENENVLPLSGAAGVLVVKIEHPKGVEILKTTMAN